MQFSNGHVLDSATKTQITTCASPYDEGQDIPVNGEINLFMQTKTRVKTATARCTHAKIFGFSPLNPKPKPLLIDFP
jgi:hypothetical protein